MSDAQQKPTMPGFSRTLPWILIGAGIIGGCCSLILTLDQIQVWQNPHYIPSCSLNPVVSCGAVIDSKQGHVFGIPAPFFGLMMFPVLVSVGLAMLAGTSLKRWFWIGMQIMVSGGVIFALWLFWLSLYRIHALCPFCLVTDAVVYAGAWYVTLYNLETGVITTKGRSEALALFVRRYHAAVLIGIYIFFIALILHHFWYYYGNYF